jgi:PAS domain S-box-containing protein
MHEAVLAALPDCVIVWDAGGRVVYANPAFERLSGLSGCAWQGKLDTELGLHGEILELLTRQRRAVAHTATAVTGEMLYASSNAAEPLWLEYVMAPLTVSDGSPAAVVCVARDVTPKKDETRQLRTAEAQIKALFDRLVSVQEEERRRLARDLHDQLGQQLTALRMNLEVFRLQSQANSPVLDQLERTQRLADDLDRSIDFLTWQLRPDPLQHLGLPAALDQLVRTWSDRFAIEGEFESIGSAARLHPDVEINFYRITQEALHNVVKHAAATRACVLLELGAARATLTVEDNGRGFRLAPNGAGDHQLGLVSMRERAELVGGTLEIESRPQAGTTVTVRVPLQPGRDRR